MVEIAEALKMEEVVVNAATWLALAPKPKLAPKALIEPELSAAISPVVKPAQADAETAAIWVEVNAATCIDVMEANCFAEICDTCFAVRLATAVVLMLGKFTKLAPET